MKARHVGIPESINAAIGNVNLYTLVGEIGELSQIETD
jgi:hypothetical protein